MKRWIGVSVCLLVVGTIPLLLARAWSGKPGLPPAAMDFPAELLPVGNVAVFGIDGADFSAKLLEAPRGNWVWVEIEENDKPRAVWLNLSQVQWIEPAASAKKKCDRCKPSSSL
jgi:hypothetical protein